MVGTGRFELPTPRTPSECSTRLSHVPTSCSRSAAADRLLGSDLVYTDAAAWRVRGVTAFSILIFTESKRPSGFFVKKKPPCTMSAMLTSESKTL